MCKSVLKSLMGGGGGSAPSAPIAPAMPVANFGGGQTAAVKAPATTETDLLPKARRKSSTASTVPGLGL